MSPRRYHLRHQTEYHYSDDVTSSFGRAHLTPPSQHGQRRVTADLIIEPEPAELHHHTDFFGNTSTFFSVTTSHRDLIVTSDCVVETDRTVVSLAELDALSWNHARDIVAPHDVDRGYRLPSPRIPYSAVVAEYAADTFATGRPLGRALVELLARIHSDFEYKSGATTVTSPLAELMQRRVGVCQDFAHLMVGCLRSAGLPARYVSGYLETAPPPGQAKLQGADASHAWASVLVGDLGWVDLDPTNNQFTDNRYIVLGVGRDYSDVPPLKGVIVTDAKKSRMRVSVDVTPMEVAPTDPR